MRDVAAKLQGTFASRETLLQSCRRLSQAAKRCRKIAGDFRESRNVAAKLQETFASRETLPQNCRRLSRVAKCCRKIAATSRIPVLA